jgi:signal transduction histidine kinase
MPDGGEIQIANSGHVNRDGRLYIELCVKDSGPGIAPEILANLFSPVRSTKGNGHQGLGLSIVHSLVKKTQGLITCRSGSKGTAFEIMLPVRKLTGQVAPGRDSA